MPQPTVSVHQIRWNEICPWLVLVRALRVSLMARVLLLAWAGVLLTQWGWSGIGRFADSEAQPLPHLTQHAIDSPKIPFSSSSFEGSGQPDGPILFDPTAQELLKPNSLTKTVGETTLAGPLYRGWNWLTQPLLRIFPGNHLSGNYLSGNHGWSKCLLLSLCGLWAIVVWGLLGGAITRIAALNLTRGETIGLLKAVQVALPKWITLIIAPLLPLGFALLLSVPLIVAGVLMRLDLTAMLVGLGWCLALVFGALVSVILIGLMIGWPLIWATVGVERTDALDGVSRCYSYVYQRPLHLVFYLLVATVLGGFAQIVLLFLADTTMQTTQWAASWGAGSQRMEQLLATPTASTASSAIAFWNTALASLVASYPMALLWSMAVGIYLLMRRNIDATEMEEIALDESEPAESLPPLEPHESGVPSVGEDASDGA